MATASQVAREQSEQVVNFNSGLNGSGNRAVYNNKPVQAVSPMVVKLPEKMASTNRFQQETVQPKSSLEDLSLKELVPQNSALAVKISQMLNRENNRVVRNWKHLAESLDVPSDVCLSFTCDQEHSPTDDLFSYLEKWKPCMIFGELKGKLRSMGRNDLVNMLDKGGIPDNYKIAEHQEFVDTFKEKLDIQSRTLNWIQLARKCGIPKKTYEKFGKPKLGPTSQLFIHMRINESFKTLKIKDLKKCLEQMDRFDVIRILEQHGIKDNALVKDEFKADTAIMEETSELLDKDLRSIQNWRNLAVRLGIPNHEYEDFDTSKVNNRNPTMLLLDWLASSQPELKTSEFVKHLQKILRNDVVEELQKGISEAIERINKRPSTNDEPVISICGSVSRLTSSSFDQDGTSQRCFSNIKHLNTEQSLNLLVTQLPLKLYSKVCAMLDAEDPFFHDYRMLAEKLGVSSQRIRILGEKKTPQPTHSLLLDYKLSLKDFMKILKEIEREDIVELIESEFSLPSTSDSDGK